MGKRSRTKTQDLLLPETELPGFFDRERLVPVGEFPSASFARRGSAGGTQLTIVGNPEEPHVAIAYHDSGAISFHLPIAPGIAAAGSARRGTSFKPSTITFQIGVSPKLPSAGQVRRGIVGRIVKVVVAKIVDTFASAAISKLGGLIEEREWKKAGLQPGWVRVCDDGLARGRLYPAMLDVPPGDRALLLLHGTFSDTLAGFKHLCHSSVLAHLREQYGRHIYGFDHFTISRSPAENVTELLTNFSSRATFDVITHSRGGLVLRTLASDAACAARFRVGKAILVASPNLGTPLAQPKRWEQTLGWFANLLDLFPENPFTTAAGWLTDCLAWLAKHATTDLPGLSSMNPTGPVVERLAGRPAVTGRSTWYALTADFAPGNLAARLADMGVDQFFKEANDLVVPTSGALKFDDHGPDAVPADRIGRLGEGGNLGAGESVHHCNFFSSPAVHQFLLNALVRENDMGAVLSSPSLMRGASVEEAPKAVVSGVRASKGGTNEFPGLNASNAVRGSVSGEGWNAEDALNLIVLPTPQVGGKRPQAQLLVTYGSARVLAPFKLGGDEDKSGSLWHGVIAFQRRINDYAEGRGAITAAAVQESGRLMFELLFRDEVRRLYDQARYRHRHRKLNVIFTSMIPWVADLPWEFAFDPSCKTFLATSDVRFVRNVLTPVPPENIEPSTQALRILLVSAQPSGVAQLSDEEERSLILRAFRPLMDRGLVIVDVLLRATPTSLHEWVQVAHYRKAPYDVVHFIGHGEFDDKTDTGYLVFEDDRGSVNRLDTGTLKDILRSRGIRLMFLNACQSGRGSRADYNKGVAPGLVADGVPAVVANQYSVLDRSATSFSQHFYECLVRGLSLGDAARESRIALNYQGGELIDWAVPVLFARNPDATLCKPLDDGPPVLRQAPASKPPLSSSSTPAERSRSSSTLQRRKAAHGSHPQLRRIAIWDVTDRIPELESTISAINEAQGRFEFKLVNLTAPLGTWRVDNDKKGDIAYLSAERVAERLRDACSALDADYLLCVTDLPLRDETTNNLYFWSEADLKRKDARVAIFSTWGFDPPLRGLAMRRALTNMAALTVATMLAPTAVDNGPRGSLSYFNAERDIEEIVGPRTIDAKNRRTLMKLLPESDVLAIDSLLRVFHPVRPLDVSNTLGRRTTSTSSRKRGRKYVK